MCFCHLAIQLEHFLTSQNNFLQHIINSTGIIQCINVLAFVQSNSYFGTFTWFSISCYDENMSWRCLPFVRLYFALIKEFTLIFKYVCSIIIASKITCLKIRQGEEKKILFFLGRCIEIYLNWIEDLELFKKELDLQSVIDRFRNCF